jgi:hypothetical protein
MDKALVRIRVKSRPHLIHQRVQHPRPWHLLVPTTSLWAVGYVKFLYINAPTQKTLPHGHPFSVAMVKLMKLVIFPESSIKAAALRPGFTLVATEET